ncbi:MAG TPA: bestrophin family ion channel [Sandaracinaceae bacterium LLY-WYZ-13_1]|nr:bestrophin family ion channel [Sandaracinaceae bacterium LLY-WYZ-13_1]
MLTGTRRAFVFSRVVFLWQWRYTLTFLLAGSLVTAAYETFDQAYLELPTLPLAVVGAALGIFVSFRTNSAYDRWWEGRKLWGRMINESRHWASQVASYVPDEATRRRLVHRHVAYVHALRCLLRKQDPFEDEAFTERSVDDAETLRRENNLTHALLARQLDDVVDLEERESLSDLRLHSMDRTLRELVNIQGGCERIKKTPMPPLYGLLATRLVQFYAVLFPLAVVKELGWWTIPVNLLVCTAFSIIAEAGRVLEDPFTLFFNGLPLSAISRMIEVDTRQRIGETDLPPMLTPDRRGVLM